MRQPKEGVVFYGRAAEASKTEKAQVCATVLERSQTSIHCKKIYICILVKQTVIKDYHFREIMFQIKKQIASRPNQPFIGAINTGTADKLGPAVRGL